jgi:hypothetical protein
LGEKLTIMPQLLALAALAGAVRAPLSPPARHEQGGTYAVASATFSLNFVNTTTGPKIVSDSAGVLTPQQPETQAISQATPTGCS